MLSGWMHCNDHNVKHSEHNHTIGLAFAVGAAVLFSFKPILIKMIYVYQVDSLTLLAWRMIVSLPIYIIIGYFLFARAHKQQVETITTWKKYAPKAILVGFIGYYLAALFDLMGLQYVSAQLERLVLFTYPTLVAVLGWLFFQKTISKQMLMALVLSYLGVSLIFIQDWKTMGDNVVLGSALVVLAALSFALYVLLSKPIIDRMGGNAFTVVAMISSSVCILIHFFLRNDYVDLVVPGEVWWMILVMAIVTTVLPTFMIAQGIARIGPDQTALSGTIGPITTSLFAVVLLDESFGLMHLVGLGLVMLAVAVMQRKRVQKVF